MNYRPTEPTSDSHVAMWTEYGIAWWEDETSIVTVAGLEPDDQDELDALLPDHDERRKDRRLFG